MLLLSDFSDHLKHTVPDVESGLIVLGGAMLEEPIKEGVPPKMKGSVLMCVADTEEEVLEIGATTPVMNTGVTLLTRDPGARRWAPTLFNSTEHLEQHGAPVTQHGGDRDVFSR